MWIMLNNTFLSIVNKGDGSGRALLVRARCAGDIERVFPAAEVVEGAGTDYAFRARIEREQVAQALADQVRAIDYDNFKNSTDDPALRSAYGRVWMTMLELQRDGD